MTDVLQHRLNTTILAPLQHRILPDKVPHKYHVSPNQPFLQSEHSGELTAKELQHIPGTALQSAPGWTGSAQHAELLACTQQKRYRAREPLVSSLGQAWKL